MTPEHLLHLILGRPRLPREAWEPLRAYILRRDGYRCQFRRLCGLGPKCGRPAEQVDHIVPVAVGGTDDPGNLRASCARCNARKGDRPPIGWRVQHSAALILALVSIGLGIGLALSARHYGWALVWQATVALFLRRP